VISCILIHFVTSQAQSVSTFRHHLRHTTSSYGRLSCHLASVHQRALILFIQTLALYKSFTYLLTSLQPPGAKMAAMAAAGLLCGRCCFTSINQSINQSINRSVRHAVTVSSAQDTLTTCCVCVSVCLCLV